MGETQSTFGEPDTVCFVPPVKSRGGRVEVDSPLVTSPPKMLGSQQDPTTENTNIPITKLKSTPPAPIEIEFDPNNTHDCLWHE